MKTVTIDILSNEAVDRLKDLEAQKLIRMHKQNMNSRTVIDWERKYKGAMTQQNPSDVDQQLNELRNGWE